MWKKADRLQLYGACALQAGYLRLKTHNQNMKDSLLVHSNNCNANVLHCYVIRILPLFVLPNIYVLEIIIKGYLTFLNNLALLFK